MSILRSDTGRRHNYPPGTDLLLRGTGGAQWKITVPPEPIPDTFWLMLARAASVTPLDE